MLSQEELPKEKSQNPEWIFGVTHVYGQSYSTHSYSTFHKCIITRKHIFIEKHFSIRIDDIKECDHALITRFRSIHTKLLMLDGTKIEIAVADPFYPNFKNRNNASEAWAFKEIINGLMAGQQPDYPKSPYDRAKHKAKFYPEDIDYDPNVSPLEYYDLYRKRWTTSEIIIKVIICVFTWLLGLMVILLIMNYLSN